MLAAMNTNTRPIDPYPAAVLAVDHAVASGNQAAVEVHPIADRLARQFPRHSRAELCAAVITAIALRGAAMRWHPAQAVRSAA